MHEAEKLSFRMKWMSSQAQRVTTSLCGKGLSCGKPKPVHVLWHESLLGKVDLGRKHSAATLTGRWKQLLLGKWRRLLICRSIAP